MSAAWLECVDVAAEIAVTGRTGGAAPVWDITSGTVLRVETGGETVHRFDPAIGRDETLRLPQPVAAAHTRRAGGLVLTLRDRVALLDPDDSRRWLVYWGREGVLGAAAAVDQAGQLRVATAGDGTLLRVQADGAALVALQGADLAGIVFSPDASTITWPTWPRVPRRGRLRPGQRATGSAPSAVPDAPRTLRAAGGRCRGPGSPRTPLPRCSATSPMVLSIDTSPSTRPSPPAASSAVSGSPIST